MEGRSINVNVKPHIYQYIVQNLGSDTVPLRRGRSLTRIIVPHLALVPSNEEEPPVPEGFMPLKFELPAWSLTCESATGRVFYCYPLFRSRITPEGEAMVRRFLSNSFKQSFRTFMDGYVNRQEETKGDDDRMMIKSGVVSFLQNYHIEFTEALVTSLTRDWYRHRDSNEEYRFSPLIY